MSSRMARKGGEPDGMEQSEARDRDPLHHLLLLFVAGWDGVPRLRRGNGKGRAGRWKSSFERQQKTGRDRGGRWNPCLPARHPRARGDGFEGASVRNAGGLEASQAPVASMPSGLAGKGRRGGGPKRSSRLLTRSRWTSRPHDAGSSRRAASAHRRTGRSIAPAYSLGKAVRAIFQRPSGKLGHALERHLLSARNPLPV